MPLDRTGSGSGEPANYWFAINPDDNADLDILPRAIYVGLTGTLVVRGADGHDETFTAIAVGYHPLRPRRILYTGTTAGGIKGLY